MNSLFVSYSHAADVRAPWKARLLEHLKVFTAQDLIEAWDVEQIPGGLRWEREIENAIRSARQPVFHRNLHRRQVGSLWRQIVARALVRLVVGVKQKEGSQ